MYKQRCCGSKGPLIPIVVAAAIALILYSALDTAMRLDKTNPFFYMGLAVFFTGILYIVWRYFIVTYEYLWVGGQLIIRRYNHGKIIIKCSIPASDIVGMWPLGRKMPMQYRGLMPKNHCATISGILCQRCTLLYRQRNGKIKRVIFEPSDELKSIVAGNAGQ